MMKSPLDGLALGLAIGAIAMCGLFWALDAENLDTKVEVMDFATLIVPLIAAYLALRGISNQIRHSSDLDEKARLAKLDAAKAVLPLVLSSLLKISKNRALAIAVGQQNPVWAANFVLTPDEILTMKDCIQFSDGRSKKLLEQAIRIYQVLCTRYELLDWSEEDSLFSITSITSEEDGRYFSRRKRYSAIYDWVVLNQLAGALLYFARTGEEPISDADIRLEAIKELRWISSSDTGRGDDLVIGKPLINNSNFRAYIDEIIENEDMGLLTTTWE